MRAWAALLNDVARPARPVVLPLHPGTRLVLEREGVTLSNDVKCIEPLGYRMTLALELHAAAILTDSGGVQREGTWLGTPCLVLRQGTEWVDQVMESGGRVVCIGLDAARAVTELERLAPVPASDVPAIDRVARAELAPSGAAEAIRAVLERDLG